MRLKIAHVTVNVNGGEMEYDMNIPAYDIHKVLNTIGECHPSVTSIVVIFTRETDNELS